MAVLKSMKMRVGSDRKEKKLNHQATFFQRSWPPVDVSRQKHQGLGQSEGSRSSGRVAKQ